MAITKITTGVISLNAVTATIVAENVITSSELATNAVDTLQITNEAVTSAKLDTNIDVAGTLDVTGVLTADSNVVIAGNLTVNGTTVTNSATNTTIEDALIELGTGTSGTPANDAGIIIERGSAANAFIGFDESADKFIVATTTATGSSTGDLTLTAAPLVTGALTASGLSYPTSDGSSAQVIQTDGSGNLSFGTVITGGAVVHNYTATGDGSTATFDTGINPQDEVNTWVHIDGVYQNKSEYSYNGTSITFTSAPDSGAAIDIISGTQSGFSTADSVLGIYSATTTDTATYDTGLSASTENNVNIFIEGVYQPKSTYTWSGSTITFDANTPVGLSLEVMASKTLTSGAVVTASIADDAVTAAKLASNSVVSASIVNNSITGADISATTSIVASTFTGNLVGNVTGNVVGNVTGTIQTAAQPNITSVGTLTGFTSTGIDDNATATAITIDSSENVGIGTNNPSKKLHVHADVVSEPLALFQTTSAGDCAVRIEGIGGETYLEIANTSGTTGNTSNSWGIGCNDDTNLHIAYGTNGTMNKNSDNAQFFINSSTGNVGIGTESPSANLDIVSTGDGLKLSRSGYDTYSLQHSTGNGMAIYNVTDSRNEMFFDGSGNVGIGSGSPTSYNSAARNLVIKDTGNVGITIAAEGGGDSTLMFADGTGGTAGYRGRIAYSHAADRMEFHTAAAEAMRIDSSGRVGIGETNPSEKLHVYSGTGNVPAKFESGDAYSIITFADSGTSGTVGTGAQSNDLIFYSGDALRMRLTSGGVLSADGVYNTATSDAANVRVLSSGNIVRSTSSRRYKNTITDASKGLTELNDLRPVTYKGNNDGDTVFYGLIAEEVHDAGLTEFVEYNDDNEPDALRYPHMVSLCIKAIQELKTELDAAKARITELEG